MIGKPFLRCPAVSLLVFLFAGTSNAPAQSYPTKPVRLIIPSPPGGPNDAVARPVAQKLSELLGQPVVTDFRAGAAGIIGAEVVAKSPPDGYTLLQIATAFTISPSTYAKLPFDPIKDFTPISLIASSHVVLVVNPSVPTRTIKELVALAKQQPGKLTFASSGNGTSLHLAGELVKIMAKVDMLHVPYKGGAPALIDVLSGHVDLMFISLPPTLPHIKAGKLRALGVASPARAQSLPKVPTISESGLPGFQVDSSYGILAPGATPKPIIAKLNAVLVQALQTQEVKERYAALGLTPVTNAPTEFAIYLREEIAKWAKVARAARIEPQ